MHHIHKTDPPAAIFPLKVRLHRGIIASMGTQGNPLKKTTVDRMWHLFREGCSVASISRKCRVSHTTVRKYRRKERWDNRRDDIIRKAQEKADKKQVSLLAENMKHVQVAKSKLMDQINAVVKNAELSKTPISDLDKLIRLEEFLHGRPDSRQQIDYCEYTEEQLTIEFEETLQELLNIPECRAEARKLLGKIQ